MTRYNFVRATGEVEENPDGEFVRYDEAAAKIDDGKQQLMRLLHGITAILVERENNECRCVHCKFINECD
jgi:hypothetical protein